MFLHEQFLFEEINLAFSLKLYFEKPSSCCGCFLDIYYAMEFLCTTVARYNPELSSCVLVFDRLPTFVTRLVLDIVVSADISFV